MAIVAIVAIIWPRRTGGNTRPNTSGATTLHKLGRTTEARATLGQLHKLMEDARFKPHGHMQRLVTEAEALISEPQRTEDMAEPAGRPE